MRKVLNDPWPLIIFITALSVRLIYIIEISDHPFFTNPQLDARHYDDWAWGIAQGNWIGGDKAFFISPFYAYFLAAVYLIFGHNYFIVRLIQVILGSLTWVFTYWVGKDLFSKRVGVLASLIGAFYSYSIFMDGELLKNSFAVFTATFTIYLVLKAKGAASKLLWFLAGLSLGITVINQPNVLLFLPFIAIWGIDLREKGFNIISVCIFVLGAMFAIFPVTARNYAVEKDIVLVSYGGGINFFLGNNADSDGGTTTSKLFKQIPQREEGRTREIPEKALGRKLRSSEISQYWFSLGKKFINENPLAFIRLTLKKLLLFWNWYEIPDNIDYYFFRHFSVILGLPLPIFGVVAPLSILGLFLSIAQWRKHVLIYGIIFIYMVSVVMFVVIGRYRLQVIPILCIYAGSSLIVIYDHLKVKDYRGFIFCVLLLAGALAVSNLNILRYPSEYSQKILGNLYMKKGMYREAIEEYRDALKVSPFDSSLRLSYAAGLEKADLNNDAIKEYRYLISFPLERSTKVQIQMAIASILMKQGDARGAEEAYEQALRLDENLSDALNNLAWLYLRDGKKLEVARGYAEKALEMKPDSPDYMDTLGMILLKENKKKEAIILFKKALSLNPDSTEIKKHLEEAMQCCR